MEERPNTEMEPTRASRFLPLRLISNVTFKLRIKNK